MLIEYNYQLSQVRYVREAMKLIGAFRPDNKVVPVVDSLVGNAKQVRQDYLDKHIDQGLARGAAGVAHTALHEACVNVYACLKSAFRNDGESLGAIDLLPVADRSVDETFRRGKAMDRTWGKLPNPPEWAGPFAVGPVTHAAFTGLVTALETAVERETAALEAFQKSEGALHRMQAAMGDFVTAALTQGRGQFSPDTPEREVIDTVPTATSTQAPGQAVASSVTSPAAGAIHAEFDAPHATSFQVWLKGPADEQFVMVDEAIKPGVYDATGLAAGNYELQFVGENSRGTGPASAAVAVTVAVAAVA